MSSDDYWGDELDSTVLKEVDMIEKTQMAGPPDPPSDDYDMTFEFDEAEIARVEEVALSNVPSKPSRVSACRPSTSTLERQSTLDGHVLPPATKSSAKSSASAQRLRKTMIWDQTRFAESGRKRSLDKGKGKGKGRTSDMLGDDEDVTQQGPSEFEQFPAPEVRIGPPPPMKLKPDLEAARTWIYPTNQPRRDYQFNIVTHSLFDNTLVALPTGLGKTFIAGVVMLNYYRWFPQGKVIFVAPTKPLVAQQIEACHQTCGIPGSDAVELTGQNARTKRRDAWAEKRVFYMTPQTLYNDLASEDCDPTDIVLLVVDEAHKARGDYAYAKVVRLLMARNSHFRVLALTATPGSDRDSVQEIVNALHISHIEIREEDSLDVRSFIHNKNVQQYIVELTEEVLRFRDQLSSIMKPMLKKCHSVGVLSYCHDPVQLHHFAVQQTANQLKPHENRVRWDLLQLGVLSRALSHLLENSIQMCYTSLLEIHSALTTSDKASWRASLARKPEFQAIMKDFERHRNQGFKLHPKLEKVKAMAIEHFVNAEQEHEMSAGASSGPVNSTRIMVFSTFRACVDEIVQVLNEHRPLLRAAPFIGQGSDKAGKKGLAQKDQIALIKRFKAGEFNILVATSIGEEGLDIGEVDMIICCDAQKAPIRMLQRVGRTGRKRAGHVGVLLAPGREEKNWNKASNTYKEVQHTIVNGSDLELYGDVERLLPDNVKPQCKEERMIIEEYVRHNPGEESDVEGEDAPRPKTKRTRVRNGTKKVEIPKGAVKGFVSVAHLLAKGSKRRKLNKGTKSLGDYDGEEGSTDEELAAGIFGPSRGSARTKTATAQKSSAGPSAGSSRHNGGQAPTSISCMVSSTSAKRRAARSNSMPTAVAVKRKHPGDADGTEVVHDFLLRSPSPPGPTIIAPPVTCSDAEMINHTGFDSFRSEDNNCVLGGRKSSPKRSLAMHSPRTDAGTTTDNGRPSGSNMSSEGIPRDTSWLLDSDSSDVEVGMMMPAHNNVRTRYAPTSLDMPRVSESSLLNEASKTTSNRDMPPPPVPAHVSSRKEDASLPEASQAIRPAGKMRKRNVLVLSSSPSMPVSPSGLRRIQRRRSNEVPRREQSLRARDRNPMFEMEATHSGDEISEGDSDVNDHPESESDRRFIQDLPETQISPSYNQTQFYHQSLFTQAPGRATGPIFAHPRVGAGPFSGRRLKTGMQVSSSPPSINRSDDYEFGSFVVRDDDVVILSD